MKQILENIIRMEEKEYKRFKIFFTLFVFSLVFYFFSSLYATNELRTLLYRLDFQCSQTTPHLILPEVLEKSYPVRTEFEEFLQTR